MMKPNLVISIPMNYPPTNKLLVVIAGPTASGKTAVGVQLAKKFNTEVISADSRQFYKQMQIGTARPLPQELEGVPHHFMGFLDVHEDFSAGKFAIEARNKIDELFNKNKVVFVVGGSGFYIDSLIFGMDDIPKINPEIRSQVNEEWHQNGLEYLQKKVQAIDPEIYQQIDVKNPMRLIRAIEVFYQTGKTLSFFQKNNNKSPLYPTLFIGLEWDRIKLYDRINLRVESMINNGLVAEVGNLSEFRLLNALQTVGYTEIFEYLDNKIRKESAIDLIKRNTRRYAKRQLTWFRKNPDMYWIYPENTEKMVDLIVKFKENKQSEK